MDWREITVADDGTHHIRNGQLVYDERYDEVLAFHAPGLAPVRRGGLAWHIDESGQPACARRFIRAFGFYEGRAAVMAGDGWHHILPDGADAYPQRYAWCGNYQGGRVAVRTASHEYLHLDLHGRDACPARWRYAGDFRYGVAVVQREDGYSTHIDVTGGLIHGKWYVDLDVFHKGLARARAADGWMHVDRHGRPAYARRFRAVEPFYNGQGRVERFDGALEIIDETGNTMVELRASLGDEVAR